MRSKCDRRRILRIRWAIVSIAWLLTTCASPGFAGTGKDIDFVVVVNAENPAISLSVVEVSRLFLKKTSQWKGGGEALPVDQSVESPVREAFTKRIHRRGIDAVKAFWQQRIFSGRDVPPPVLGSDQDVLAFVEKNKWAVGYVAAGTGLGEGVRAIPFDDSQR